MAILNRPDAVLFNGIDEVTTTRTCEHIKYGVLTLRWRACYHSAWITGVTQSTSQIPARYTRRNNKATSYTGYDLGAANGAEGVSQPVGEPREVGVTWLGRWRREMMEAWKWQRLERGIGGRFGTGRDSVHDKDGKTTFGVHRKAFCVAIECTTFNAGCT